jgi:hypothetical protein
MYWKIFNGRYKMLLLCLYLLTAFGGFGSVSAQTAAAENKWEFLTEVYLMFANINGDIGVGNSITVPVDADPADVFSKLQIGGMLYLEAGTGCWVITSDLLFMNLQQDITPDKFIHSGTVTLKQTIWELAGLYRILPFLEAGVGGRLNYLETDIAAQRIVFPAGTEALTGHLSKTFYDPILITRLTYDIENKWLFQLRGDLGGFGIGSDFTWQLQAYVGYRFATLFQLSVGYRIISIDYDKGENEERFIFDMNEFGPAIKLGFNL